jgi:hypothetical protein
MSTGEVYFARAAPEDEPANTLTAPNSSHRDPLAPPRSPPPTAGGKAAARAKSSGTGGQPAAPAVAEALAAGEIFIVGEQHYTDNNLANPYQAQPIAILPDKSYKSEVKCGIAPVAFDKLMKYIESLDTSEDGSTSASFDAMLASDMLSYYRPKGRLALLSPFLHVSLIVAACIPTLALFTLWGINQYAFYYYTITQTTAFGFLFVCFYL